MLESKSSSLGNDSNGFFQTKNFQVTGGTLDGNDPVLMPDVTRKEERAITCTGFQNANWEKALQQRKLESNLYYKGQQISKFVQLSFFKIYGSGIYLFFAFIWQISLLFLFFSFISVISIAINMLKGNAYQNTEISLQFCIVRGSIGNYQFSSSNMQDTQSINYKIANVVVDIVACFAFLVFTFYWQKKSEKIVHQINNSIKLLSSNTIQVLKFPQTTTQIKINQFMSQFGDVQQVAPVKNYSDQIQIFKQIYEIRLKIKQLQIQKQIQPCQCIDKQIEQLTTKANQLQKQSQSCHIKKQEIIKFYVQFGDSTQRQKILQKFKPYQKTIQCCSKNPPEQMMINNQRIWLAPCQTQPTGIIWQNAHVTWRTRWLRALLQVLIILIVIAGGFLLISFLNILSPPSESNIDTQSLTIAQISNEQNKTIVRSWCVKNFAFQDLIFPIEDQLSKVCYPYWKSYFLGVLIKVSISVVVIVLKSVIKIVMVFIAKFQKYSTHTEQSVAIMTNLLITYISTTVLITFLMQANIFSISFKSIIRGFVKDQELLNNISLISQYYDLTSNWYRDIGYQIWFNLFILSFVPHFFMPLLSYLLECLSQCSAKKQKLHKKMYDKIRPAQFEIEDNYANILMIILIGFIFGGGSPFMILVSFIGIITRYVYFKYNFIRFNRVPRTYNEALNNRALTILKVTLMIRCLLSIYMYGAEDIFAMEKSAFMKWSQSLNIAVFSSIFIVISRVFLTWYYSIFAILFFLCFIFKDLIVNNLINLCKRQQDLQKVNNLDNAQFTEEQLNKIQKVSQRILTKSYKLQNNPDYYEILAIMKMKYRNSLKNRQSITPTPLLQ